MTKIDRRDDVNPDEGERKHGDVLFADSVNNKYPIGQPHPVVIVSLLHGG